MRSDAQGLMPEVLPEIMVPEMVPEMVPMGVNFGSARGTKLWWCPRDGARGNFVVKQIENRLKDSWAPFRGHCLGHHLAHHSAL